MQSALWVPSLSCNPHQAPAPTFFFFQPHRGPRREVRSHCRLPCKDRVWAGEAHQIISCCPASPVQHCS
ncbi:hypothetical protein XELAEV_18041873mg [Xenopus laevis]|uniref:Uncharacterized protein n=1 Tax=Xenopus laevis TaxID=8355 RepID=A0A974C324_XENLA|nr:hypothetical protein XELAEV_18041873mg [Xenopus laevis]